MDAQRQAKEKLLYKHSQVKQVNRHVLKLDGCFWVERLFETVFQSITSHLPKRGRMERKRGKQEKNNPKNSHTILTVSTAGPWLTIIQISRIPRL